MPTQARLYIATVVAIGLAAFTTSLSHWNSPDPAKFVAYLIIAILGSVLKVKLPGVTGTMSVYFLFLLIGIVQLTLPETVAMGCAATVVQVFWHAKKRPTFIQYLFNFSSSALSATVGYLCYWSIPLHSSSYGTISPLKLALASLVFFALNTGTISGVIALTENKSVRTIWKDCYFWSLPYYLVGASIAALFSALSGWIGWEILILVVPVVYLIHRSYRLYLGRLEAETVHASQMAALHLRTIEALALAIDAKDHNTHDHLQRLQVYSREIANELGLSKTEKDALQAAALLHDIGKLAVPEHIISKPGKLTDEEFEKMKIHPLVGAEILARVEFPYPVVPIVRSHHEKWDGTGYPDGLKGEAIPLGARILAAVDHVDALASDRPHRRAVPLAEAVASLRSESGRSYDPRIVDILARRYLELENLARTGPQVSQLAKLSTGLHLPRNLTPADSAGANVGDPDPSSEQPVDFISSIAAARQEVQGLFELAQELGRSLSLPETLSVMAARLNRMIPHDAVAIYVLRDKRLRAEYFSGVDAVLFSSLDIPMGEGISGWVADSRNPILNGNPSVEFAYLKDPSKQTQLASALSVPLDGGSGVLGTVTLYSRQPDGFSKDQQRVLMAISSKLSVSVENALRFQQAESSATTDFLTGLPNARSLFLHLDAEVKRCERSRTQLTVLVCDLDGFKDVNDRFGHLAGNELLREVAIGLRTYCREYDYVARMGGDEFVIVIPGLSEDGVAQKVRAFGEAVHRAGVAVCREPVVAMSVGEAHFPADGADAEQLLAEGDKRMYKNKRARKKSRSAQVTVESQENPAVH